LQLLSTSFPAALDRASKTLRDLRIAEVAQLDMQLEGQSLPRQDQGLVQVRRLVAGPNASTRAEGRAAVIRHDTRIHEPSGPWIRVTDSLQGTCAVQVGSMVGSQQEPSEPHWPVPPFPVPF